MLSLFSSSLLLLQIELILAFFVQDHNNNGILFTKILPPKSSSIPHKKTSSLILFARKGAMSRRKIKKSTSTGFDTTTSTKNEVKKTADKIYSLPALYDLAFGYRNYREEVDFLLYAHEKYSGFPAMRILELAAGPGRHSIEALKTPKTESSNYSNILQVTALDKSPEMVAYGKEIASDQLEDK